MYETIIKAVENVLVALFTKGITMPLGKSKKKEFEYRISELEKIIFDRLEWENKKEIASNNDLYLNQALQLFFKVLEYLNIQIIISSKEQENIMFKLDNKSLDNVDYVIKSTAQEVLDLETIKPLSDIINTTHTVGKKSLFQQGKLSSKDILQKSRERFQKKIMEGEKNA